MNDLNLAELFNEFQESPDCIENKLLQESFGIIDGFAEDTIDRIASHNKLEISKTLIKLYIFLKARENDVIDDKNILTHQKDETGSNGTNTAKIATIEKNPTATSTSAIDNCLIANPLNVVANDSDKNNNSNEKNASKNDNDNKTEEKAEHGNGNGNEHDNEKQSENKDKTETTNVTKIETAKIDEDSNTNETNDDDMSGANVDEEEKTKCDDSDGERDKLGTGERTITSQAESLLTRWLHVNISDQSIISSPKSRKNNNSNSNSTGNDNDEAEEHTPEATHNELLANILKNARNMEDDNNGIFGLSSILGTATTITTTRRTGNENEINDDDDESKNGTEYFDFLSDDLLVLVLSFLEERELFDVNWHKKLEIINHRWNECIKLHILYKNNPKKSWMNEHFVSIDNIYNEIKQNKTKKFDFQMPNGQFVHASINIESIFEQAFVSDTIPSKLIENSSNLITMNGLSGGTNSYFAAMGMSRLSNHSSVSAISTISGISGISGIGTTAATTGITGISGGGTGASRMSQSASNSGPDSKEVPYIKFHAFINGNGVPYKLLLNSKAGALYNLTDGEKNGKNSKYNKNRNNGNSENRDKDENDKKSGNFCMNNFNNTGNNSNNSNNNNNSNADNNEEYERKNESDMKDDFKLNDNINNSINNIGNNIVASDGKEENDKLSNENDINVKNALTSDMFCDVLTKFARSKTLRMRPPMLTFNKKSLYYTYNIRFHRNKFNLLLNKLYGIDNSFLYKLVEINLSKLKEYYIYDTSNLNIYGTIADIVSRCDTKRDWVIGMIGWANCRPAKHRSNQLRILIDFTPEYKQLKPLNIITNYYKLIKLNCTHRMSYSQFRDSNSNESRRTISFDNDKKRALMAIWVHPDCINYNNNTAYNTAFDSALNDDMNINRGKFKNKKLTGTYNSLLEDIDDDDDDDDDNEDKENDDNEEDEDGHENENKKEDKNSSNSITRDVNKRNVKRTKRKKKKRNRRRDNNENWINLFNFGKYTTQDQLNETLKHYLNINSIDPSNNNIKEYRNTEIDGSNIVNDLPITQLDISRLYLDYNETKFNTNYKDLFEKSGLNIKKFDFLCVECIDMRHKKQYGSILINPITKNYFRSIDELFNWKGKVLVRKFIGKHDSSSNNSNTNHTKNKDKNNHSHNHNHHYNHHSSHNSKTTSSSSHPKSKSKSKVRLKSKDNNNNSSSIDRDHTNHSNSNKDDSGPKRRTSKFRRSLSKHKKDRDKDKEKEKDKDKDGDDTRTRNKRGSESKDDNRNLNGQQSSDGKMEKDGNISNGWTIDVNISKTEYFLDEYYHLDDRRITYFGFKGKNGDFKEIDKENRRTLLKLLIANCKQRNKSFGRKISISSSSDKHQRARKKSLIKRVFGK